MVETNFKQTEIGLIPEDWQVKSLGSLLLKTPDYGINAAAVDFNYNLPTYIRITDISDSGKFLDSNKCSVDNISSYKYFLEENDLVFARTGASVGKSYHYNSNDGKLVFAGFLIRVKANSNLLNSKFLFFNTQSLRYWDWVASNSMRSGQPGLNSNEFKSLQLAIPPSITEQQAIASALTDADAWIEGLEKLIAKKRLLKQGAMQQLLTPKEDWEVKKLGEVADIIMGQSPLSQFYNAKGIGLPLIQGNADILNRKTIIRNYTSNITKNGKQGDIIMSVRAPVGEIANASFDCCLGRGVCAIRYKNKFLYHFLIFKEGNWSKLSTGSTFDSITSEQIRQLEILLPNSNEQILIAKILSDMDKEIDTIEHILQKAQQIKQGMMQQLLTGKVRLVAANKTANYKEEVIAS